MHVNYLQWMHILNWSMMWVICITAKLTPMWALLDFYIAKFSAAQVIDAAEYE